MSEPERLLWQSERFRVVRLEEPAAGGGMFSRDVIRHPGAVAIVPLVAPDQVCLIRNRRAAAGRELLEIPAGTLTPGEDPLQCAQRELAEETGYVAARWTKLHEFFVSPGVLDERMHLYLAEELRPGTPRREPGEWIENHVAPLGEALQWARTGRIEDAKTLIGLWLATAST